MTDLRDTQVSTGPVGDEREPTRHAPTEPATGPVVSRVLVVGNEPIIADSVPASLRFAGYDTHLARTGTRALEASERLHPHLIILDTDLPDIDASTLARQLRRHHRAPLLYLTAPMHPSIPGLNLTVGADSYLTKPFSLDELAARVRTTLRRAHNGAPGTREAILRFADLQLNEETRQVHRAGQPLQLTPREGDILRYMLVNAGRIVTRAHILEHVWPYDHTGHARVLDVHICTLRRKIHRYGAPLIHTLHGIGYILRQPDHHATQP